MTSFYDRHIMPRLIRCACNAEGISRRRARVVPLAQGRVLEVGCGGGLNFQHYDSARVSQVIGLDPSAELRRMAEAQAVGCVTPIDVCHGVAEAVPFEDSSFDTVVLTFTLCTVGNPAAALSEIRRVLKPQGKLLFCEHGQSPEPPIQVWQHRLEPIWKRLAGGCHLSRPITALIEAAGFKISDAQSGYIRKMPKVAAWIELGSATVLR